MTLELEDELTEQRDNQWCSHPFKAGDGQVIRCRSLDYSYCPSCAALNAADVRRLIEAGFVDGDYTYWFVTLTAPSMNRRKNQYRELVSWNNNVGKLWNKSTQYLKDSLPKVEYVRVIEYQRRGAVHIHSIMRVGATDVDVAKELKRLRTYRVRVDGKEYRWGKYCDVQQIDDAGNAEGVADYATKDFRRQLSYVTGYNVKMLGKSLAVELDPQHKQISSQLTEAAIELKLSRKAVDHYGFSGQEFSKSKGWCSLTKSSIKEDRQRWAMEHASTTDDAQRERIYQRELNARERILSARSHRGQFDPTHNPEDVRKSLCGTRGTIDPQWLTNEQLNALLLRLEPWGGQ